MDDIGPQAFSDSFYTRLEVVWYAACFNFFLVTFAVLIQRTIKFPLLTVHQSYLLYTVPKLVFAPL